MIVDYIEGSPAKKLKVDVPYRRIIITGDGHCIARCFPTYFGEPLDKVLDRLYLEFRNNTDWYGQFSEKTNEEILSDVFRYITEKCYNSDTVDMALHGFSCIYEVKVIVVNSDSNVGDIILGADFSNTIELYKHKDHFDLLSKETVTAKKEAEDFHFYSTNFILLKY